MFRLRLYVVLFDMLLNPASLQSCVYENRKKRAGKGFDLMRARSSQCNSRSEQRAIPKESSACESSKSSDQSVDQFHLHREVVHLVDQSPLQSIPLALGLVIHQFHFNSRWSGVDRLGGQG